MLSFPPSLPPIASSWYWRILVGECFLLFCLHGLGCMSVCRSVCMSAVYFAKEVNSPSSGWFLWFHCSFVSSSSFVVFFMLFISKLLHWSSVNCLSVLSHIPSAITSRPLGTQPPSLIPDLREWKCKLMKKQIHLELFPSLLFSYLIFFFFIVLPSFSSSFSSSKLTITTTTQRIHHNLSSDWSSSYIIFSSSFCSSSAVTLNHKIDYR